MCVNVPHYLLLARFTSITLFSATSVIIKSAHHYQAGRLIIIKSFSPSRFHEAGSSSSSRSHQAVLIKPSSSSRPH
jgi:hypothetical protein